MHLIKQKRMQNQRENCNDYNLNVLFSSIRTISAWFKERLPILNHFLHFHSVHNDYINGQISCKIAPSQCETVSGNAMQKMTSNFSLNGNRSLLTFYPLLKSNHKRQN